MSRHHYCCYFDHRYLARGLAMIRSLRRFEPDAVFWVLCLSELCESALQRLDEPNVRPIGLTDFEEGDPALIQAKSDRSLVEYYFTCTPSLVRYVMRRAEPGDVVTYVDGDLFFFASPAAMFEELGDGAVSIIPHRFPPPLRDRERFGLYNVGWLSFRNEERGASVVEWWRARCNEWCYDVLEGDRFADQKYLDRFAELFDGVIVLGHPGANLAPWNIGGHRLTEEAGHVRVDGHPLIFFHFHGVRTLGRSWFFAVHNEYKAPLTPLMRQHIYRPYVEQLVTIRAEIEHLIGPEAEPPLSRARPSEGLIGRLKARLRQPKRFLRLFLAGQALFVRSRRAG